VNDIEPILFLSVMHCTGEHGKSAKFMREELGVKALSACVGRRSYLNYGNDFGYMFASGGVKALVESAKTVIFEEALPADYGIAPSDLAGKICIRDAHGSYTRKNAESLRSWDNRYPTIIRTPDLKEQVGEKAIYIPCAIDYHDRLFHGDKGAMDTDKVIIAHAPSNPTIKGTALLVEAMKEFEKNENVEIIYSQGEPNAISLFRRKMANVYFDVIADGSHYGYHGIIGVAGIEAAAQSQVVIGNFEIDLAHSKDFPAYPYSSLETVADIIGTIQKFIVFPKERRAAQEVWRDWAYFHRNRATETEKLITWIKTLSPYS